MVRRRIGSDNGAADLIIVIHVLFKATDKSFSCMDKTFSKSSVEFIGVEP